MSATTLFHYRARSRHTGRVHRGLMEAESRPEVVERLLGGGAVALDVRPAPLVATWRAWRARMRRPGPAERGALYRQLASMLGAGLPLLQALEAAAGQAASPLRKAGHDLVARVNAGETLSAALAANHQVFPPLHAGLVRVAEESGNLDIVLARLAAAEEEEAEFGQRLRSAATYPAVVLLFSLLLVAFLVTFVVPTFSELFRELDVPLPLPTRLVLAAASPAALGFPAGAAAAAGLVALARRRARRRSGRGDARPPGNPFLFHFPGLGPALTARSHARLLSSLATLLRSGHPLPDALATVAPLAAGRAQAEAWEEARRAVLAGQPLSASLRVSGALPPMALQLLAGGEEAGNVDDMLDRAAEIYAAQARHALDRLASALEPVLIVTVGGIVATVAASLFLPVFRLINALGGKI